METYYYDGRSYRDIRDALDAVRDDIDSALGDSDIDSYLREEGPVVCDGEGIVWVPGFPVRDGLSAKDEKDAELIITYSKLKEADLNERQR